MAEGFQSEENRTVTLISYLLKLPWTVLFCDGEFWLTNAQLPRGLVVNRSGHLEMFRLLKGLDRLLCLFSHYTINRARVETFRFQRLLYFHSPIRI